MCVFVLFGFLCSFGESCFEPAILYLDQTKQAMLQAVHKFFFALPIHDMPSMPTFVLAIKVKHRHYSRSLSES